MPRVGVLDLDALRSIEQSLQDVASRETCTIEQILRDYFGASAHTRIPSCTLRVLGSSVLRFVARAVSAPK
jgi:hypothetical protein